jgi:CubicO group peptidase (beta-lactamase class C family)
MKTCRRWLFVCSLVTLVLLLLAGCSRPPQRPQVLAPGDYTYLRDYISWLVGEEMGKNKVQGLSIALVDDQRLVLAAGFGFADRKAQIPADADTSYRAGSISKLFTCLAALQLVDQGRMELDRPLADYVPDFAIRSRFKDAAPVTIRNLMTHHSGLPANFHKGMWTPDPQTFAALPTLLRNEYTAFPPDKVFAYSNLGMSLLGLAVQDVAGEEFAIHLRRSVFAPLGMEGSDFAAGIRPARRTAKAYRKTEEVEEPGLRDLPAGGLNTSVRELSRFIRMVLNEGEIDGHRVLPARLLHEMLSPQNAEVALDEGFPVGLGWMLGGLGSINLRNVGPVAHHSGATFYHRAQLIVLPEAKLGVVVMANTAEATQAVNRIATAALSLAAEIKTGRKQPQVETPPAGHFLSDAELWAYAGHYATLVGLVSVSPEDGYLNAKTMGKSFRLVPRHDNQLQLQYRVLGLLPIDLGDLSSFGFSRQQVAGHEILRASDGVHTLLVGEKLTMQPIPTAWQRRTGRYRIVNQGNDALLFGDPTLRIEGGFLVLECSLPNSGNAKVSSALRPLADDTAVVQGLWQGAGETLQVVRSGAVEQLVYSGYHLVLEQVEADGP